MLLSKVSHDEAEKATLHQQQVLSRIEGRLDRLTDAFLDGHIGKETFHRKKETLLLEQSESRQHLDSVRDDTSVVVDKITGFLELAENVCGAYELAIPEEKREILKTITSNRQLDGKRLAITYSQPYSIIASRPKHSSGAPERDRLRTWSSIVRQLVDLTLRDKQG